MVSRIHSAYVENSCSNEVNHWFLDVSNFNLVKKRVLNHELNRLSEMDRLFVVSYLVQKGLLHSAAGSQDSLLLLELLNAGANINAVDKNGKTPLEHIEQADLFLQLLQMGALSKQKTLLNLIDKLLRYNFRDGASDRVEVFSTLLAFVPLEDFALISDEQTRYFWGQFSQNNQLKDTFLKFIEEFPSDASKIIKKLLKSFDRGEYLRDLINFFAKGSIKRPLFEEILFDSQVLFWNLGHADLFTDLKKCYAPSEQLVLGSDASNDFRFVIYIEALLRTKTLEEAVYLLDKIEIFEQVVPVITEQVKSFVLKHIENLQKNEKSTIWRAYDEKTLSFKRLKLLQAVGLDPNWVDKNQRNFLFSSEIWYTLYENSDSTLNFEQVDRNGDNALEFFCRTYSKHSQKNIKKLSKWGLGLKERFPNFEKCQQLFPEDSYLQALLGAYLLANRRGKEELIRDFEDPQRLIFEKALHPDNMNSQQSKSSIGWKEKIDVSYHEKFAKKVAYDEEYLDNLCSFWETPIPINVVELIPESPLVSLLIQTICKQHEEKHLRAKLKPLEVLFYSSVLSHDDMVFFNRYMFEHPETMKVLVDDYMILKKVFYQMGGGSKSKYGKVIHTFISAIKKIDHIASSTLYLPSWHQYLIHSFDETPLPKPVEYLTLPLEKIVQLNRTSVLEEGELAEGYKFLKVGENYEHFSQEVSVSNAFRQLPALFKSRIIEPVGLFTAKQLDPKLEESLKHLHLAKPITFIHYKASRKTFKYLNDLPLEDYEKARFLSLEDAAKMVRLGIYPDIAALFHNNEADRKYVLLVDLMAQFKVESVYFYTQPAGGSGRLDQPFAKTKYPNARDSGLTDLRDANVPYCFFNAEAKDMQGLSWGEDSTRYFSQMHGLSSILLVDMLILAEREQKSGRLSWDNDASLLEFGLSLAEAFAHVSASYSEKPLDQCRQFALGCGIDWTLAARQIAFWIDTSEKGYPSWIAQGKIPENIYEKGVQVTVNVERAKNFDPVKGCSSDGHQDIGLYNGPSGLEEFTKACYLLFVPIALCELLIDERDTKSSNNSVWSDFMYWGF